MYGGEIVEEGLTESVFTPPFHPYTEALLSAIPVPDPTLVESRIRLDETLGEPETTAAGCHLAARCSIRLGSICDTEAPPSIEVTAGHTIRCHMPADELQKLQNAVAR